MTCLGWLATGGGLGFGFSALQPMAPAATTPAMIRPLRNAWRLLGWLAIVDPNSGLAQHFKPSLDKMDAALAFENAQVRC